MVAKGGNRSVKRVIQSSLLGSGEDGTAAARRKSSAESGGVEDFHEKLEKQEVYHTALYTLRNGERRSREQLGTVDF